VADITVVRGEREVDVALHAPASAPGVADNPVGIARGRNVVANSLDAVVNRAGAGLEDTTGVGLPRLSGNAHRQRASTIQRGLELSTRNIGEARTLVVGGRVGGLASGAEFAVATLSDVVRIIRVELNAVALLNRVDVSIMRPATVAAIVVVGAGSALLLTIP